MSYWAQLYKLLDSGLDVNHTSRSTVVGIALYSGHYKGKIALLLIAEKWTLCWGKAAPGLLILCIYVYIVIVIYCMCGCQYLKQIPVTISL